MFTGIIEKIGFVESIKDINDGKIVTYRSILSSELNIDDSISINGVCQTVIACESELFTTQLVEETLRKTNFGELEVGNKVNLERSMTMQQRLDGHIVQGHVDTVGTISAVEQEATGWLYTVTFEDQYNDYIVGRGSIAINGISLTVAREITNGFVVAIIPYTYEHTNMHTLSEGSTVNLEFDILGKYVLKYLKSRENQ
jgi:riboflavin synthase